MKAVQLNLKHPGSIEVRDDAPEPVRARGDVLIRVRLAGICSTDLELARGYMGFRGIPGHEFVGEVIDGPTTLRGKRVVGEINCACGTCDLCLAGLGTHCRNRTVLGIFNHSGAFAERIALPAENCHVLPPEISDEQAVFVEPLAAAVHVLDAVKIDADTRVTVIGLGRLGNLIAQVLATTGCRLTAAGRNPRSIELCRACGVDADTVCNLTLRMDQDVVIEATGTVEGLKLAMQQVRPCGTIILKSTYAAPPTLDLAPIVIHEIRVIGSRCGAFAPALQMLAAGRIRVNCLIDARYPLSRANEAMEFAAQPGRFKTILECS